MKARVVIKGAYTGEQSEPFFSEPFDAATVDHVWLERQIGQTVVRAINHCRDVGRILTSHKFVVTLERD
jgi:hypothetical protein